MSGRTLENRRAFLKRVPLFENLNDGDYDELAAIATEKRVAADVVLFRQNDPGDAMYFIVTGSVRVSVHLTDGTEVTVGRLGVGEEFGEIALFDGQARTATVTSCEPTQLLVVERAPFLDFLTRHPSVAIHMLAIMARRLRSSNNLLTGLGCSDVSLRLAELLQHIARAYGKYTRAGVRIDTVFSDRELGEIAGLPREAIAEQLRNWSEAGLIKMNHGYITLVRPDDLSRPFTC